MALKYLWSGATGTADGSSMANAYTSLGTALVSITSADDLAVASDHSETQSTSQVYTFPGTLAHPTRLYAIDRNTGAYSARSAAIATGTNQQITLAGIFDIWGVKFTAGAGSNTPALNLGSNAGTYGKLTGCLLALGGTGTASRINFGTTGLNTGANIELVDTQVSFANASQSIATRYGHFLWRHTANAIQGTTPTTLFLDGATSDFTCEGVDLSAMGSGKTLVAALGFQSVFNFIGCTVGASVAVSGTQTVYGARVYFIQSDSGSAGYREELYTATGTLTTETTLVLSGGPSDGSATISYKVITSANCSQARPFELPAHVEWVATTGSTVAQTWHFLTDNVSLTSDQAWVVGGYLGTAGSTLLGLVTTGRTDPTASASALANDNSGSWTTTGLGTPTKQKAALSFTAQKAGPLHAIVKIGVPSTTVYVSKPASLAA